MINYFTEPIRDIFIKLGYNGVWLRGLPTGCIIGSVEIVGCVINHPSIWAEKTENYTVGMNPKLYENITGKKPTYNWILANPVLFEKPIPAKGKLSFWDFDGELPFDEILEANKEVLKRIKEEGGKP